MKDNKMSENKEIVARERETISNRERERDHSRRDENLTERDHNLTLSNIDLSILPEGFQYALLPLEVRGESLKHDFEMAIRMGWYPVSREEIPGWGLPDELRSLVSEGEIQHQHQWVMDRGRVLVKMPIHKYQRNIVGKHNDDTIAQRESIAGGIGRGNDIRGIYERRPAKLQTSRGAFYEGGIPTVTAPEYRQGSVQNTFGR